MKISRLLVPAVTDDDMVLTGTVMKLIHSLADYNPKRPLGFAGIHHRHFTTDYICLKM
jgi:hypothetical protein